MVAVFYMQHLSNLLRIIGANLLAHKAFGIDISHFQTHIDTSEHQRQLYATLLLIDRKGAIGHHYVTSGLYGD